MPRHKVHFPPRTRTFLKGSTRSSTHTPHDAKVFGPPISRDELHARLVLKKAF